jgi:hypothetical protein
MGDGCVMDLCSKTGASRKKQLQQQSIESHEMREKNEGNNSLDDICAQI